MKQNDEKGPGTSYCAELFKYNKVHRLIGNVSCETLVKESASAINNTLKQLSAYSVMVDVGAGAGVLGYAWLKSHPEKKVIFLEPDRKAAAFLHMYFSKEKRARVIQKKLQDLTLEEIAFFEVDKEKIFLASRAFSSSVSLEEAYSLSKLPFELYSFATQEAKGHFMQRLST